MTESEINRFFDRNRNYGTDRIGSILVQQMLEKIGGKIEISSVPGEFGSVDHMIPWQIDHKKTITHRMINN